MITKPAEMTESQIRNELDQLDRDFDNRGDHGGSPAEWIYERMCELATALKRGDHKP